MTLSMGCELLAALERPEAADYTMGDYQGARARWCPGCGDHSVLTAVQRLLAAEQLKPEQTVFVSGIGCSSRFPHYLKTYGFHGIHGRALPVATGIKLQRPDLTVFVVMGDGDCTSIGAGHWVHALRYNLDLTVLLLDNGIYGLTKNQTSPTTPQGWASNTQPRGSWLPPLNPLSASLGISNVSFVAQTAEWLPAHLFATLRAGYRHRGLAFVRILQRCPAYTPALFQAAVQDPAQTTLLTHPDGIGLPEAGAPAWRQLEHNPHDLAAARRLADAGDQLYLGLLYRDSSRPRYEELRRVTPRTPTERIALLNAELDRYAV